VEDRIELALAGDPALIEAASVHRDYVAAETLAVELHLADASPRGATIEHSQRADVDGMSLTISLSKR
jgi:hypothetical protein